jgi:opacity protein-like surface antigen
MNKKIFRSSIVLGSALFMFIMAPAAMAGYIGNPLATVDAGEMALGLSYDMVSRDYDIDIVGVGVEEGEQNRIIAKGTYGISDELNIYAMFGQVDDDDLGEAGLAYGIGGKYDLEIADMECGLVFQVIKWSVDEGKVTATKTDADMTGIDLALGTAREITNDIVIYGGAMYSLESGEFKMPAAKADIDADDNIGVFIGAEYPASDQITIGAEYRAICESSISLAVTYAFD